MARLFGTDGVRGIANSHELSPELAYRLGRAGAYLIGARDGRPRIVIGKDTRISGDMLEAAMVAGICSVGADALRVGVVTTPAVAYLVKALGAQAGVMISASHNPAEYNGIKFFSSDGYKLPDAVEDQLEDLARSTSDDLPHPAGEHVGRADEDLGAVERYVNHVCGSIDQTFEGLRIVVDCANGSASRIGPEVYRRLGAEVIPIFDSPDGVNINVQCGSTHPKALQRTVRDYRADLGIAHDGDADRVIMVDENGALVDGDQIMAACGLHLMKRGKLPKNTLVATVLSNLGLELAIRRAGGRLARTRVGDRYVLEEMLKGGFALGGEQSGHIIFLEHGTTGDGILTASQMLAVMKASGKSLSRLAGLMEKMPQLQVNVRVRNREALVGNHRIEEALQAAERTLGDSGRVLIRPSGTEPLIRIMVEGHDEEALHRIAGELHDTISKELD